MFKIAMKAPIIAATIAIHVVRLALSADSAGICDGLTAAASLTSGIVLAPAQIPSRLLGRRYVHGLIMRLGVDRRIDGHAGAQIAGERAAGIENDLDRNTLHDLGEVARGIIRRQESEFLPARRRDAVHMAAHHGARERIDLDLDGLSGSDIGELGLLVIGDDIGWG